MAHEDDDKPSLLGLAAAHAAMHQDKSDPDDTDPSPAVQAAESILEAVEQKDPETLSDALSAALDLHEYAPDDDDAAKRRADKPSLMQIHIHAK